MQSFGGNRRKNKTSHAELKRGNNQSVLFCEWFTLAELTRVN